MKAVIIDDIEQARNTLKKDLATYCPVVNLVGEADGVVNGAKLLSKEKPDVLFLDIQMQDGSGFDLLEIIKDASIKVIFVTAYDAYAIKALRYSAVDYLLKPIDPDELKAAVEKLSARKINEGQSLELLAENIKGKTKAHIKLALHTQEKIHVVNITDIIRCESNVNYTEFFFANAKKMLVTKTLKDFEEILSEHGFFRVHQSHLVNTKYIKEFIKSEDSLVMNDNCHVPVSTRKRAEVMKMLDDL
ncbi:MAG: response regulator transcription factor [Bacteroidia bacterium]|nr:response regulator transcription factor [Bacteroidia bacterium]